MARFNGSNLIGLNYANDRPQQKNPGLKIETYRDIPSKPVKATIVLFYWLTRAWRELEKSLIKSQDIANEVRAARRPGSARRLPPPPSMHPHLPTLARTPHTR